MSLNAQALTSRTSSATGELQTFCCPMARVASFFDYDNDGLMDIYLLNWGPLDGVTDAPPGTPTPAQPPLSAIVGDGTFEDVTRKSGLEGSGFASAAVAGDFDNDGYTDLFVAERGAQPPLSQPRRWHLRGCNREKRASVTPARASRAVFFRLRQ